MEPMESMKLGNAIRELGQELAADLERAMARVDAAQTDEARERARFEVDVLTSLCTRLVACRRRTLEEAIAFSNIVNAQVEVRDQQIEMLRQNFDAMQAVAQEATEMLHQHNAEMLARNYRSHRLQ